MGIRHWTLPKPDSEAVAGLAAGCGQPALVCQVLAARGLDTPEQVAGFLGEVPTLDDPFLLADMEKAVERVQSALESGERICVYGDYDCDGITATALLTSYLQSEGADVIYYVPSREKEGYGLNIAAVDLLAQQRVSLVITVDNGVSAHQEIAHAKSIGIDVVVTDHHTPRDTLPEAVAVVNPHRADCPSRYKELAGVGVAFKLICALEGAQGDELLEYYSDIVTLGTIADIVPLDGENRTIVRYGLGRIQETGNPGLAALIEVAGLSGRSLTSESVAFGIIPRINAAGRIGTADDVIELLLTDDASVAAETAALVNEQNTQRKQIEADILATIESMLTENPGILKKRVLIVSGEGWHHGVVGIVSARLVEKYEKPCIVFSIDDGEARGSGRSVKGFSLIEAITACSSTLTRYGGHTMAAGLTVPVEHLDAFDREMQTYARDHYPMMPLPVLAADVSLDARKLTVENVAALSVLEPFGAGNEAPMFHLGGLAIQGIYPTNDRKHIRIRFDAGGNSFYAVYFGVNEAYFPYKAGDIVEIMAKITAQEYNGKNQLSVKIADLRPAGVPQERVLVGRERYACYLREEEPDAATAAEMLPSREDIALVYRFLRGAGTFSYGEDALFLRLMGQGIDYCRTLLALDVLEEMGFVRRTPGEGPNAIAVVPDAPRADLSNSAILMRLGRIREPVTA